VLAIQSVPTVTAPTEGVGIPGGGVPSGRSWRGMRGQLDPPADGEPGGKKGHRRSARPFFGANFFQGGVTEAWRGGALDVCVDGHRAERVAVTASLLARRDAMVTA